MKKATFLILALLLAGGVLPLLPCDVRMECSQVMVKGKTKFEVRLFVETVHRRCPLDIDRTGLAPENLAIEKQGQWQQVEAGLYRLDLTVALKGKGAGRLRVMRECPKRGLQEELLKFVIPASS